MRALQSGLAGMLTVVIAVAGIVTISRIRDLNAQVARQSAQVERAEKLAANLQAGTSALERTVREARQGAQMWSNKLIQAQAQLAEEHNTHEPLRQQIERMMQQEIVYKSQIEKKDTAIRNHDQGVSNLRNDLEAARSLATAHADRISQLEAEAKTRNDNLTAQRALLEESQKATEAARAELKQAKEQLAAAESQVAELKHAAAQTPPAPSSTNAPGARAGD